MVKNIIDAIKRCQEHGATEYLPGDATVAHFAAAWGAITPEGTVGAIDWDRDEHGKLRVWGWPCPVASPSSIAELRRSCLETGDLTLAKMCDKALTGNGAAVDRCIQVFHHVATVDGPAWCIQLV